MSVITGKDNSMAISLCWLKEMITRKMEDSVIIFPSINQQMQYTRGIWMIRT